MCACVCVCMRMRKKEKERESEREREMKGQGVVTPAKEACHKMASPSSPHLEHGTIPADISNKISKRRETLKGAYVAFVIYE